MHANHSTNCIELYTPTIKGSEHSIYTIDIAALFCHTGTDWPGEIHTWGNGEGADGNAVEGRDNQAPGLDSEPAHVAPLLYFGDGMVRAAGFEPATPSV